MRGLLLALAAIGVLKAFAAETVELTWTYDDRQNMPMYGWDTPRVYLNPDGRIEGGVLRAVASDSSAISRIAATELLRRDLTTLVFVDWFFDVPWASAKREAFRAIAEMHGFELKVIRPRGELSGDTAQVVRGLAEDLSGLPRPCGVFAVTDAVGAGGNLTNREWIAAGAWDKIIAVAQSLVTNAQIYCSGNIIC